MGTSKSSYETTGLLIFTLVCLIIEGWCLTANASKLSSQVVEDFFDGNAYAATSVKRWAVLVAGSNGWDNYRHQADVCHAYQILRKGGVSDKNIIVFMYDDIASNKNNPRPGVIINKPDGKDVYRGVPKDYTGHNVNTNNLYAVILGNKTALKGGSRKVVDSGPDDYIFIYYADHGGVGLLGMPEGDYVFAKDLIDVLKKKHAARAYKKMLLYIEACESGSIFEGLLPKNLNIYATTASNSQENSYATYCPGDSLAEFDTCLGDLYSISWMEDCDKKDLHKETLGEQYEEVRKRTADGTDGADKLSSHVMQYGSSTLRRDLVSYYMGINPTASSSSYTSEDEIHLPSSVSLSRVKSVAQRDADLLHFWHKFNTAPTGSQQKLEAKKQLDDEISHRKHVDNSINQIGKLLFGFENSSRVLNKVRPPGIPPVDDWQCLKKLVTTYEDHCGPLSSYGMKYTRAIANMCNAGVTTDQMIAASVKTCIQNNL
ncbi:hypothetical protein FNV43_RR27059 [Rhamnella rubrinervis]|uniref:Legumain prodomain domain-containing protein n=1 Tax=Rhamnella rubrinervis TaxID=2594499 RepID=A0A8K0DQJ0_9ROSA|nr:hypothetical protein FNV43_RR27059 [Rhamnella rubrinervis]